MILSDVPPPLVSRWVALGEDIWLAGPWRTVVKSAREHGWTLKAYIARGYSLTAHGRLGTLMDSVTIRGWRDRDGGTARFVAYWHRPTWPTLGRGGEDEDTPSGEGRKTTEGKTWLWHPPMTEPEEGVPVPAWKLFGCWTWMVGSPPTKVPMAQVRVWVKTTVLPS